MVADLASLMPRLMEFAILRCSRKDCGKVVRGDISRKSNPHGGKDLLFVGGVQVAPWNGTLQAACPCGKGSLIGKRVTGRTSHKACGAKCTGATGFVCDCSCGGKNHGKGHAES